MLTEKGEIVTKIEFEFSISPMAEHTGCSTSRFSSAGNPVLAELWDIVKSIKTWLCLLYQKPFCVLAG